MKKTAKKTLYQMIAMDKEMFVKAVNKLLDSNRTDAAQKLAMAAMRKLPHSAEMAKLVEKTLSCNMTLPAVKRVYKKIIKWAPECSQNYYYLGMFYKRAGDLRGMKRTFADFLRIFKGRADLMQTYIACCTLDMYDLAFETAENIIDSPAYNFVFSRLWNPWGDRTSNDLTDFYTERLARLDSAGIRKKFEYYRIFFRGVLLFFSNRCDDATREFENLPALSPERYGWMHFPAGWIYLYACDYRRALGKFRLSVSSRFSRAPSIGRMAEIYICTGRSALGFAELRKAQEMFGLRELGGLYSWEGEMRLFTGQYKTALRKLTLGLRLGDDVAFCWRGAAYAKLGMLEKALKDLNRAVELFPTDCEARVWRGEVLRLMSDYKGALVDLDIASQYDYPWAFVNRALVRHVLGDYKGMRKDFERIDRKIIHYVAKRLGIDLRKQGMLSPDCIRRMLEAACTLAMGNRRDDRYFYPIWMQKSGV